MCEAWRHSEEERKTRKRMAATGQFPNSCGYP